MAAKEERLEREKMFWRKDFFFLGCWTAGGDDAADAADDDAASFGLDMV